MAKSFLIGLVILILVGAGFFWLRRYQAEAPSAPDGSLPPESWEESLLESQLGIEVADDAEKARLSPVEGGETMGMATRRVQNGQVEHNILADLPDPEAGQFYQAWLVQDEELVSIGKLEKKKGGWLLTYSGDETLGSLAKVVVTLEEKDDNQPEKRILEGEF